MRDEVRKVKDQIEAKLALIEELRKMMQTAYEQLHSGLERDSRDWDKALDRYYAAKDTLYTAHVDFGQLTGRLNKLIE